MARWTGDGGGVTWQAGLGPVSEKILSLEHNSRPMLKSDILGTYLFSIRILTK